MEIYAIRHTITIRKEGYCYGRSELPLADTFSAEAEKIVGNMPEDLDLIISSPILRCVKLALKFKKPFIINDKLMEYDYGEWEGKKWDDIPMRQINEWAEDYFNIAPPKGESLFQMMSRVRSFLKTLSNSCHDNIALITHLGVIRCIYIYYNNIPIEEFFSIKIDFGQILRFSVNNDIHK